ncbi:MAG TPA: hypothetical protein VF611_05135, partial [Pyrinomonadaceae bacterium]
LVIEDGAVFEGSCRMRQDKPEPARVAKAEESREASAPPRPKQPAAKPAQTRPAQATPANTGAVSAAAVTSNASEQTA